MVQMKYKSKYKYNHSVIGCFVSTGREWLGFGASVHRGQAHPQQAATPWAAPQATVHIQAVYDCRGR